ncbi:hypothetical protein AVEN_151263-1 [Araneus ventricosus]|uniref:Uncharacterized protein n=1 Tax=Araneus ventricosus TaxID=182803 RepID=A0A4Y2U0G5_ARAVE|nr:hypothetical protein AVEN_151263-1 [Araneus ventricosus]
MDQGYYSSASNSLLARTADRTPKTFALQGDPSRSTFPAIQALSLYSLPRQAMTSHGVIYAQLNSFLARTAGRTPKAFALQGDPSRSRHPPSSKRCPYIVFPAGRGVTWNDLAHSWRIFSPNRDIEKIPAPLRSHISSPKSPNLSPRSGNQTWLVIPYLPL